MFVLPTNKDGMNAAIGHFIHDACAAKIAAQNAEAAEKAAQPGFVPEPYTWDLKAKPKPAFDLAVFCASIRDGVGSKRGMRV